MKIKDNGDGTYSTTACSPAQEVVVFSALAITDTTNHASSAIDVSNLSGRKMLHIAQTFNQSVTMTVYGYNATSGFNFNLGSKVFTAGSWGNITVSDLPLLQEPWQKISVTLSCTVAPTSGSANVWLEGVSA